MPHVTLAPPDPGSAALESLRARCDFCGRAFPVFAPRWDCRTCVSCAAAGAPDQSAAATFADYLLALDRWHALTRQPRKALRRTAKATGAHRQLGMSQRSHRRLIVATRGRAVRRASAGSR